MAETKKRVELVTLDTSTSMKIDEDAADSNVNSFENYTLYPEPSSEEEKAVNERVKAYLDNLIVNLSKHDNTDKIKGNVDMFINAIEEIKQKKPKCLLQKAFKDELEEAADQINTAEPLTEKIDYHIELVKELRRLSMPAEQELGKELTQAQLLSKVGKLTANIDKLKRKLIELDNAEIDLEEMDKHTYYTKKPKLQTMIVGLWMKRESYLNRSAHFVGRNLFKRFVYTGTENETINEIVTKYFINYLNEVKNAEDKHYMPKSRVNGKSKSKKGDGKFSFFSIIELKDHLSSEITKANINYTLTDAELTKIYKDLINEHHDRRMKDQHDSFRTYAQSQYIKPATAADEKDPEFIKKMDENAKNGEEALMKLINEFKEKDQRQNGDLTDDLTLPLGHDDVGDMTESEEEDEDEDDEEDEDEEEDEEEEDEEEDGEEDGEEEDAGDDSESGGQENGDNGDEVINLDDEMEVDEDCVAGPSTRLDM